MTMVLYVVRRGDHLRRLAMQQGFDAETVWAAPENADLVAQRPSMDMLCPGDILYLPAPTKKWLRAAVGSENRYVANVPSAAVTANLYLADQPVAKAAYRVIELPGLGELTTDGEGLVTFDAPMTLSAVTLDFETLGFRVLLLIGYLDSPNTLSGVGQRLRNLGYPTAGAGSDAEMRTAIAMFQLGQDGIEADGEASDETCDALAKEHAS